MAKTDNPRGLIKPLEFSLEACNIITALGQTYDFKDMALEINYYEDIYADCITGNIVISDSSGFLDLLEFTGNDFLYLKFGKPSLPYTIEKVFRIYTVSDRNQINPANETYILHFFSEEMYLSENILLSKSYTNTKVSDIVKDIINNNLKVDSKRIGIIEETAGAKNLVVSKLSPFEALNWLCNYAISAEAQTIGSTFFFFENKDGYNFRSLQAMYKQKEYGTYTYEPKNLNLPGDDRVKDMEHERWTVFKYEHIKNYNALESTIDGTFANRLIAVDTLKLSYNVKDYDYTTEFPKGSKMNPYGIITNAIDRTGKPANQGYESVLKMSVTNTGDSKNPYVASHDPSVLEYNVENIIPYRTAQVSQLNTNKMRISVPGDPLVKVGNTLIFNLPTMVSQVNRPMDKFYSGKYLVTAVRHKMDQTGSYYTIMEICKESLPNSYAPFQNNLPAWKNVRSK